MKSKYLMRLQNPVAYLFLLLASLFPTVLPATPVYYHAYNYTGPFPNLMQDGQPFTSPAIGQNVSGPGVYLWFVEDMFLNSKTQLSDRDYNDVWGLVTILDTANRYTVQTLGGLSQYYQAGQLGFAGSEFDHNGVFRLLWHSPLGQYRSGTDQVAIFKLTQDPSECPEPGGLLLGAAGLAVIGSRLRKKG